ncbi:MAG: hypothetical protein SWE60_06570 [Thermodesulfobacteriota bacterium]|nr:hypothetical protein [Thermodesulfobacteriota bacterium]
MTRRSIVYILSTSYAGSHFLSLLLGSNSRAMHIGEAKRLRKGPFRRTPSICLACEKEKKACPLTRGIDDKNIDQIYDIIFSRIDPQITTLVDASKKPFWAKRFLGNPNYELKFIHLIRDPRAYVRRLALKYTGLIRRLRVRIQLARDVPSLARSFVFRSASTVYIYRWLRENQNITHFLSQNHLQATVITYHDLAKHTAQELRRITKAINLVYEPTQLAYWNFTHHGTQKKEYEWVKDEKTTYFDLRWQAFLSPRRIKEIQNNKHVNNYLEEHRIRIGEEGLTQMPTGQRTR